MCDKMCDDANTRRRFLQYATTLTLGTLTLTILPGISAEDESQEKSDSPHQPADPQKAAAFGFLVDTNKCIGSGKCLTACRVENNVPEGYSRTWVERYIHFKDGSVRVDSVPETGYAEASMPPLDNENITRSYFVPKLCNHCHDAPCNQVCPVHAAFKSPEGISLVDSERCIGCAYCVQACPYGVRFINPNTGTADKCTWCYHRIMRDEHPACVEACPVGARVFGRIDDPDSEISKRIAEFPTDVLKAHLGTHPLTRYIGITNEVT